MTFKDIDFSAVSFNITSGTSNTFAHTIVDQEPTLLVFIYVNTGSDVVTGVTYGGVAMTRRNTLAPSSARGYLYYLQGPSSGSNNVVVSTSASVTIEAQAWSYINTDQDNIGTSAANGGTSGTSSSIAVSTTVDKSWLVSGFKASGGGVSAGANTNNRGGAGNPASFDSGEVSPPALTTINANHNSGVWVWNATVLLPAKKAPSSFFLLM